jgi:hypothetical protein
MGQIRLSSGLRVLRGRDAAARGRIRLPRLSIKCGGCLWAVHASAVLLVSQFGHGAGDYADGCDGDGASAE